MPEPAANATSVRWESRFDRCAKAAVGRHDVQCTADAQLVICPGGESAAFNALDGNAQLLVVKARADGIGAPNVLVIDCGAQRQVLAWREGVLVAKKGRHGKREGYGVRRFAVQVADGQSVKARSHGRRLARSAGAAQVWRMKQALHRIVVEIRGQGLLEVTEPVRRWVVSQAIRTGLLTIWCRHTSASLLVQENADPDVRADLVAFFRRVVPEGAVYRHQDEGPDDMPAHIKAALTQTQISVPVADGGMVLGTWQGIYVFEHRAAPHRRELVLHLIGE